jgi:hypothetical protein
MKVGEAVKFDTKKLKMVGFTDLGEHTSLHQQSKKGDHGLVIMFQPFQERWVQAVTCFLSKGCATGTFFAPFDYRMYNTFGKIWVFC